MIKILIRGPLSSCVHARVHISVCSGWEAGYWAAFYCHKRCKHLHMFATVDAGFLIDCTNKNCCNSLFSTFANLSASATQPWCAVDISGMKLVLTGQKVDSYLHMKRFLLLQRKDSVNW